MPPEQVLASLANRMITRFNLPYPTPEEGVVAQLQLGSSGPVLSIERRGQAIDCRLETEPDVEEWINLYPGYRLIETQVCTCSATKRHPAAWELVFQTHSIPLTLRIERGAPWRASLVFPRGIQ